jgi:hypothetical protein
LRVFWQQVNPKLDVLVKKEEEEGKEGEWRKRWG